MQGEIKCPDCKKSFKVDVYINKTNRCVEIYVCGHAEQTGTVFYSDKKPALICSAKCPKCDLELKGIVDAYVSHGKNKIIFEIQNDIKDNIMQFIAYAYRDNIVSLSAFGFLDGIKHILSSKGETVNKILKALEVAAEHGKLEIIEYYLTLPNLFTIENCKDIESYRKKIYKVDISINVNNEIDQKILLRVLGKTCIPIDETTNNVNNIIDYLLSRGVDKTIAVGIASKYGSLKAVKYLISIGGNYKEINNYPLAAAVVNGHFEIVKYLLDLGADPNLAEADINQAKKYGHNNIVKYIKSKHIKSKHIKN